MKGRKRIGPRRNWVGSLPNPDRPLHLFPRGRMPRRLRKLLERAWRRARAVLEPKIAEDFMAQLSKPSMLLGCVEVTPLEPPPRIGQTAVAYMRDQPFEFYVGDEEPTVFHPRRQMGEHLDRIVVDEPKKVR